MYEGIRYNTATVLVRLLGFWSFSFRWLISSVLWGQGERRGWKIVKPDKVVTRKRFCFVMRPADRIHRQSFLPSSQRRSKRRPQHLLRRTWTLMSLLSGILLPSLSLQMTTSLLSSRNNSPQKVIASTTGQMESIPRISPATRYQL